MYHCFYQPLIFGAIITLGGLFAFNFIGQTITEKFGNMIIFCFAEIGFVLLYGFETLYHYNDWKAVEENERRMEKLLEGA